MKQPYTDVLDDYFDALLEEHANPDPNPKLLVAPEPAASVALSYAEPDAAERRLALEALLAQVAELKEEETATSVVATQTLVLPQVSVAPAPVVESLVESVVEPVEIVIDAAIAQAEPAVAIKAEVDLALQAQLQTEQTLAAQAAEWRNMDTEQSFQVLFFEVAGMTFAVPLTHLGGIYQVAKQTSLFGKPDWFSGVQTERDRQIYAVDTARWAMPGHKAQEQYEYLVTLGESHWGLGCHQLKGTELLTREQIKWRATPGARPWLAGMVKERMCALLHVDALVALLGQGKNIDGQQV